MAPLFTLTIFLSALLLFSVQPLMARLLLPSMGGSATVWNTAMVFFQAVLLGGYLYAHGLGKRVEVSRRILIFHAVLVLIPLAFLPLALPRNLEPPATAQPTLWLMGVLLASVGAPFFVLSTSSPLLQRMFALTSHRDARDPYFLYAASNAGSLIALLAYPLVFEPNFALSTQTRLWAALYGLYVICTGLCLWATARAPQIRTETTENPVETRAAPPISWRRRARWIALALVPSSLMLSVTTYLSSDIAGIPLLWIVPLALYLASFMVVFARRPLVSPQIWARLLAILILPLVIVIASGAGRPLELLMALHLGVFFLACLVCHGELSRDRPDPSQLTQFYGWMALGGVVGGGLNALLSPLLFSSVVEYPLSLVALCLLLPRDLLVDGIEKTRQLRLVWGDVAFPVLVGALCLFLVTILQNGPIPNGPATLWLMFGIPSILSFLFSRRPPRFALAIAAILWCGTFYHASLTSQILDKQRSFFGVHRVLLSNDRKFVLLTHGSTTHGLQRAANQSNRTEPLSYYSRQGPVGDILAAARTKKPKLRVAVVGLGAGVVASYIEAGEVWDFYEIDPKVAEIASNPRFFTFLSDAAAKPNLILGDARLQLQKAPEGAYDLILLDAYSSDSIPVHLLTREALALYERKLAPRGAIAWHISNNFFDLEPVVARLSQDAGFVARTRGDFSLSKSESTQNIAPSQWAITARSEADMGWKTAPREWAKMRADAPLWSDEQSSLWALLIRKWARKAAQ